MIADKYIAENHPKEIVLKKVGLVRSSYFYKQIFSKRGRNAYLLNIIDVYSRVNIGHLVSFTMKAKQVTALLDYVFKAYNIDPKKINILIRTDNGCQFIAGILREYLASIEVLHEYIHVATPEENAYVESFHSIIEREFFRDSNWSRYLTQRR